MTLNDMLQEIPSLSIVERKRLLHALVDSLTEESDNSHSILELEGLGAEIWNGIDAQDYINNLRDEWDHR